MSSYFGFPQDHPKDCLCDGHGIVCEFHPGVCWGSHCGPKECQGCCGGAGMGCVVKYDKENNV